MRWVTVSMGMQWCTKWGLFAPGMGMRQTIGVWKENIFFVLWINFFLLRCCSDNVCKSYASMASSVLSDFILLSICLQLSFGSSLQVSNVRHGLRCVLREDKKKIFNSQYCLPVLWFITSRLAVEHLTAAPAHFPHSWPGEGIGKVKAGKPRVWDKTSVLDRAKAASTIKQDKKFIHYFLSTARHGTSLWPICTSYPASISS